jgi:ketosteroid isomerase-like protein
VSRADIEVLRRAYEAFNRRDLDALTGFFDPEAYWVPSPSVWGAGKTYHGHEGLAELLAELASDWRAFESRPEEFREVGDLILVLGRVHAVPAEGDREIDSPTAWIWEMRNGKALLLQAYADPAKAFEALGLNE